MTPEEQETIDAEWRRANERVAHLFLPLTPLLFLVRRVG